MHASKTSTLQLTFSYTANCSTGYSGTKMQTQHSQTEEKRAYACMPEALARANHTKQLDACETGRAKGGCECMATAIHETKDRFRGIWNMKY